jgi:probable rRNA maturation factor
MIQFSNADRSVSLRGRTAIKDGVRKLFRKEGKTLVGLRYIFCSDAYLLQINRDFLQHDYYTDIITFEMSESDARGVEGEIYISIDRVRDNAASVGVSVREEMLRVICHGALHLCGYEDKTETDQKKMRAAEDRYIRLIEGA